MTVPLRQEVASSVRAAWRIAWRDPEAMRGFNLTIDGFWRSFYAAVLLAPPYAVLFLLNYPDLPPADQPTIAGYLIIKLLLYLARWAAFPLAMIPIASLLRLGGSYVPLIIAYNWASVVQTAILLPLAMLLATGMVGGEMAGVLLIVVYMTLLYYAYLVIRTALNCDAMTAIGLVVLDTVLALLLGVSSEWLL